MKLGKMSDPTQSLIDNLVDELEPAPAIRPRTAMLWVAVALSATAAVLFQFSTIDSRIAVGQSSVFFYLTTGLLLVLGLAATGAAIGMAQPQVGARTHIVRWALVMAVPLPLAAALLAASDVAMPGENAAMMDGLACLRDALLSSVLVAVALFAWLRSGAPVAPARAGFYVGVAATALGSVVHGLTCPYDGMIHLGIAHVAPIVIGGLVGRLAGARLLRW